MEILYTGRTWKISHKPPAAGERVVKDEMNPLIELVTRLGITARSRLQEGEKVKYRHSIKED
ncbi:hypothetical protein BDW67DRAFT_97251 [Aspergillus spinulosporus]